jgi:hypothetical protein
MLVESKKRNLIDNIGNDRLVYMVESNQQTS